MVGRHVAREGLLRETDLKPPGRAAGRSIPKPAKGRVREAPTSIGTVSLTPVFPLSITYLYQSRASRTAGRRNQSRMPAPLISVIIPTYNRPRYLGEAIESVLGQSYGNHEIIVVDDGSTDPPVDAVAAFGDRVVLLRQDNRGTGAARNTGIARSSGEFLAFLDDDDVWDERKLALQMQAFGAAPETDVVYGHMKQFVTPGLDEDQSSRLRHLAGQVVAAPIAPSMLIRRDSFDRVGPFDESLQIGVEMDWYARLCEAGLRSVMLDAVLYHRRLHGSNVNITRADEQSERLLVLKRIIDRRRQAAARST